MAYARERFDDPAAFDNTQPLAHRALQFSGRHAVPFREIALDFFEPLAELTNSADLVAPLMVVEPDREMNQRLQEPAVGLPRRHPNRFKVFMAIVKLLAIEKVDPFLKDLQRVAAG